MIPLNHPSGASGKKDGVAAMDGHLALSQMSGNQSNPVSELTAHRFFQPLTAPAVRPETMLRWKTSTRMISGMVTITLAAMICPKGFS
ncbi:hypothetical protein Dcar01_00201 [Deinococcus carri]|uniref:Transposase n=1 Tax=Deinococcus carri TaxID=1211323 RepID=A0ABP9W3B6_9DEIO